MTAPPPRLEEPRKPAIGELLAWPGTDVALSIARVRYATDRRGDVTVWRVSYHDPGMDNRERGVRVVRSACGTCWIPFTPED